jgi:NAD(P)-dependent dehydrogenase (short-subunit alcohol dehydrogenase family)
VIGFSKSLANAYTENGVFSNVVAPTATDTPMYAEERRPSHREKSPLGRLITPTEVAEAVEFFATTTCISGKVLEVDGAYH